MTVEENPARLIDMKAEENPARLADTEGRREPRAPQTPKVEENPARLWKGHTQFTFNPWAGVRALPVG